MTCSNCGTELEEGAKFCLECGAPVPQTKKCIHCGEELPLKAKFCPACGNRQDGGPSKLAAAAGFAMGDKNVMSGDVTGHKEETHVAGNATIIKNEDQTRQVKKCHVCGSMVLITAGFECPECGQFTCADCYDKEHGICAECASKTQEQGTERYKQAVQDALADGRIDFEERKTLVALQKQLGISGDTAAKLEQQVKNEKLQLLSTQLLTIEQVNLKKAKDLFYNEADAAAALPLLEKLATAHPDNEEVLNVYLPVLGIMDADQALKTIHLLQVDLLAAYVTEISILLQRSDLTNSELKLNRAQQIWPDNTILKCQHVLFTYGLYKQTSERQFLEAANTESEELDYKTKDPLERSYIAKVEDTVVAEYQGTPPRKSYDKSYCEDNGLYYGVMTRTVMKNKGELTVGSGKWCDYNSLAEALKFAEDGTTITVEPGVYIEHRSLVFDKKVTVTGYTGGVLKNAAFDDLPVIVVPKGTCTVTAPASLTGLVFTHDKKLHFTTPGDYAKKEGCAQNQYQKAIYEEIPDYGDDDFECMLHIKSNAELSSVGIMRSGTTGLVCDAGTSRMNDCIITDCRDKGVIAGLDAQVKFEDCMVSGAENYGIEILDDAAVSVLSCSFFGNGSKGVSFISEKSCEIRCSRIYDNAGDGVEIYTDAPIILAGCTIYTNKKAGIYVDEFCAGNNITVQDCSLFDNGNNDLPGEKKKVQKAAKASASTHVDEEGKPPVGSASFADVFAASGLFDGSDELVVDGKTYKNLASAVAAAKDGGVIKIKGEQRVGSFTATLSKNITIRGLDDAGLVLGKTDFKIGGKVTFKNLKFSGNDEASLCIGGSGSPVLENCRITGGSRVIISGSATPKLTKVEITGAAKEAIEVQDTAAPTVKDCKVHNGKDCALWIHNKAAGTYDGCAFYECGDTALVHVNDRAKPVFTSCTAYNGKRGGFSFYGTSEVRCDDCTSRDNTLCGFIIYKSAKPVLTSCIAKDNNESGFFVYDKAVVSGTNCKSLRNRFQGYAHTDTASATWQSCSAEDNTKGGFRVYDGEGSPSVMCVSCEGSGNGSPGLYSDGDSKKKIQKSTAADLDKPVKLRKGSVSKITLKGPLSYSYNESKKSCSVKVKRVQNDSPWGTGDIKLILWLSKGTYNGGSLKGFKLGEFPFKKGIDKGYGYPDVEKSAELTGKPEKGTYTVVITVNEHNEDGNWYIAGWFNFSKEVTWK